MKPNQDKLISKLTVRLKDSSNCVIGTGIIYYSDNLNDSVYIITASHCLFEGIDSFETPLTSVTIDFYNDFQKKYFSIIVSPINERLLFKDIDKDIAVIVVNRNEVEKAIDSIPILKVVNSRQTYSQFIVKGFPNATQGKELDVIFPTWKQEMTSVSKFQLQLHEDYNSYATEGFSGSGILLYDKEDVYLYGIFTRFREEDNGKVIYGQHIKLINELLKTNFLPLIDFTYLGDNNLNHSFFKTHVEKAINNLGQRYSQELNLELPISKLFNDIVRDRDFKYRFFQSIDDWFDKNRYTKVNPNSELYEIENRQVKLKDNIKDWYKNESFEIPETIDIQWIVDELVLIQGLAHKKRSELFKLQLKNAKTPKSSKKSYNYQKSPYENELYQLRELISHNDYLQSDFANRANIKLTNYPILILKGEAGSGKSHLLGDIAQNRINKGLPSILLLGQHFKNSVGIENNIKAIIGLEQSFESFLRSLNQIGKQLGERIPILIDALNEGAGVDLWREEVLGFINSITDYPYVGLVLSIRTTYFDLLFSEPIDSKITLISHEGFAGNEYAALKLFCEHYGLKQPEFPILAPEFTKPLFLILICKGVQGSPKKEFPQGFQGIGTIFNFYLSSLEKRFKTLREEYELASNLVSKAIQKFSNECFTKGQSVLILNEAIDFFKKEFDSYPSLLNDLIKESVFIRNRPNNYWNNEEKEEVIYFAYERFGDYFIANNLIKGFKSKEEVISAFKEDSKLGKLSEEADWTNKGILESLAIQLPEIHNLELFEVYHWLFSKIEKDEFGRIDSKIDSINHFIIDSLKWRKVESIDDDKLTEWLRGDFCTIRKDEYLMTLTELSTVKDHPFNSNRLHRILFKIPMPERDTFWQSHSLYFSGYNDYNIAYPIKRLIDWAWSPNISEKIDSDVTFLAAQTLSWLLVSTNRKLRDEVTKALVNLLEQQPKALLKLLEKFNSVDDFYILERLYSIAYGCILRTRNESSIEEIGNFVYQKVFSNSKPPEHILLRDYARNIVEYMVYKGLGKRTNIKKVRPPYKSQFPQFPTEKDIKPYYIDHKSPEYDKDFGYSHNKIHVSVMTWDFGRYTIDYATDKFCPISFTKERAYKKFLKKVSSEDLNLINTLAENLNTAEQVIKNRNRGISFLGEEKYNEFLSSIKEVIMMGFQQLEKSLGKKIIYVKKEIIPYLHFQETSKKKIHSRISFDSQPARRWIVKRAFELGYNAKIHGQFEKSHCDRMREPKIERIGKKYQWIAFHEILAKLSDHYKIRDEYSTNKSYHYIKGSWEFNARDIDPIYITKNSEELPKDDMMLLSKKVEWWHDQEYNYWNKNNSEWIKTINDLPKVKYIINKKDDNSNEWLFLNKYAKWEMPKPFGADKYDVFRKEIWYLIQGYLIKKSHKKRIIAFLKDKNFWGRWMPESPSEFTQLFNREKYWSPIYKSDKRESPWQEIYYNHKATKLKVLSSTLEGKGSISDDKSGAESNYQIPCEKLFNDLSLNYAPRDGDFETNSGELVIQNIPFSGGAMIKKQVLLDYLEDNGLDMIWTLLGEKMAFLSRGHGGGDDNHFSAPCGVFYIENGEIEGQLNYHERD